MLIFRGVWGAHPTENYQVTLVHFLSQSSPARPPLALPPRLNRPLGSSLWESPAWWAWCCVAWWCVPWWWWRPLTSCTCTPPCCVTCSAWAWWAPWVLSCMACSCMGRAAKYIFKPHSRMRAETRRMAMKGEITENALLKLVALSFKCYLSIIIHHDFFRIIFYPETKTTNYPIFNFNFYREPFAPMKSSSLPPDLGSQTSTAQRLGPSWLAGNPVGSWWCGATGCQEDITTNPQRYGGNFCWGGEINPQNNCQIYCIS